jgi:Domain of unknown function (DUF4115)
MLIGGIAAAVAIAVLSAVLLTRRVVRDDVHSVEGYHRSLHTLEAINAHPVVPKVDAGSSSGTPSAYPESAVRVAGTSTVRLTAAPPAARPPIPAPSVPEGDGILTFDDSGDSGDLSDPLPQPAGRDKALVSINHRRRRLAAPATAVAAVLVLIIVLLVTGSHNVASPRTHKGSTAHRHAASTPDGNTTATTTPTTQSPSVTQPQASTAHGATYDVSASAFALSLSVTSGACWVEVTSSVSGATLFAGTLEPGQEHSLDATGPVNVMLGAPTVFVASINGETVALPPGFQTPFTMSFVTVPSST